MRLKGMSDIPEEKLKSLPDSEMLNLNRMEAKLERQATSRVALQ
jgi:hypothetical protein